MTENYNENQNLQAVNGEAFPDYGAEPPFMYGEEIKKAEEGRKLRKEANIAGACFLGMLAVTLLISISVALITAITYTLTGSSVNLSEPPIGSCIDILFSVLIFTGVFTLIYKLSKHRISDLVSFKRSPKGMAVPLFFFGVSICAFANIASSYIDSFFKGIGVDYAPPAAELPSGVFGFMLSLLATAVVPALAEEFALRGLVLGSLKKYGEGFALITSAVCFGLMHSNLSQIPFAFTVGLFLGFAVIKTGSLRVSVAVHFYNNLTSVVFGYLPHTIPAEIENAVYAGLLLISLLVGILMLIKTDKDLFTLKESETLLSEKEKFGVFFKSGTIIAFLILSLLEAALYIII